jgi:hypothetical protein
MGYGLQAFLALIPPPDPESAIRPISYSIGATILAVYCFRSKQVELTFPRTAGSGISSVQMKVYLP